MAVQRPLREPLATTRIAIASDDPDALVARLPAPAPAADPAGDQRLLLAPAFGFEFAGLVRDAAQPG